MKGRRAREATLMEQMEIADHHALKKMTAKGPMERAFFGALATSSRALVDVSYILYMEDID